MGERKNNNLPLKASPMQATTQVWTTVFSWRVKGLLHIPSLDSNRIHDLMKKKPNRPAATLSEGMIPTVRLSLWVMRLNTLPNTALTTKPRTVICSHHGGTGTFLKEFSLLNSSPSSFSDSMVLSTPSMSGKSV